MKRFSVVILLFCATATLSQTQEEMEMVSVPKSKLTEQQKAELNLGKVQSYAGMGKEIGEAVNSSMAAITTQSNNFAQTPVGKLTVLLVIWKVIGDQAVHVFGAVLLFAVGVPIWLWSYRRMCITRSIRTGKETWQVIEYRSTGDFPPRQAHGLIGCALIAAFLLVLLTG